MFKTSRTFLAAALLLASTSMPAFAIDKVDADKMSNDKMAEGRMIAPMTAQEFVTAAAQGSMLEIQSSQIAVEHAKRDKVVDLAKKMIEDHTAAANELKSVVALKSGLGVPPELDVEHKHMLDKVNGGLNQGFDRAYLDMQVQAHNQAVELFRGYGTNGSDPDLKAFAQKYLPTLKAHQDMVNDYDAEVQNDPSHENAR